MFLCGLEAPDTVNPPTHRDGRHHEPTTRLDRFRGLKWNRSLSVTKQEGVEVPEEPGLVGLPVVPVPQPELLSHRLDEIPHLVERLPSGGERKPGPGGEILRLRGPVSPEVPLGEQTVTSATNPVVDEDIGGLTPPLRPTADDTLERGEREEVGSSLPREVQINPFDD